ncbi:MAG TPA: YciI family protein [Mycobacteriales bacterium]|nr:YciI family protein [Mycobacteriales bacterium]
MRYLMLVCGVEPGREPSDEEMAPARAWTAEMTARGVRRSGDQLGPAGSATTVRVRDGQVLLSDGPFAETYEQILGYDLLECANLDEAIEVASRHPTARWGSVEVRPVWTG